MYAALIQFWIIGFYWSDSFSEVLHVPEDYATIQAALDHIENEDTILVAVGEYTGNLLAPSVDFVMLGDVEHDSTNYVRPIIDTAPLSGADSLACLTIPDGISVTIEDFVFRNGPAAWDTLPRSGIGGIDNSANSLILQRCLFDSTRGGTSGGHRLAIEDCEFRNNVVQCARTETGPMTATNTLFSGQCVWQVSARDSSTFHNCTFRDNSLGHLFVAGETAIVVENCVFEHYDHAFAAVSISADAGCIVRNNRFSDFELGYCVLEIHSDCTNDHIVPIQVIGNTFENYTGGIGQGGDAIMIQCDPGNGGFMGVIDSNVFANGETNIGFANAVPFFDGEAEFNGNRMENLIPQTTPDVKAIRFSGPIQDTVRMRDNLFEPEGLAASTEVAYMNAELNWWGDSTGPYHPTLNPAGQGASVGDNIDFIPWLEDTTDESDVPERPEIQAHSYSITAYPNPFNPVARISFSVAIAGDYSIAVFDITGRRIQELYRGMIANERQMVFNGTGLPSGVYIVEMENVATESLVASGKLLLLK